MQTHSSSIGLPSKSCSCRQLGYGWWRPNSTCRRLCVLVSKRLGAGARSRNSEKPNIYNDANC